MIKNYQDGNGFVNVSGIENFKKRLCSKKKGYRKPMTPFFRYSLSLIITYALFFFFLVRLVFLKTELEQLPLYNKH